MKGGITLTKVKPTKIKINYTILMKVEVSEYRHAILLELIDKLRELPSSSSPSRQGIIWRVRLAQLYYPVLWRGSLSFSLDKHTVKAQWRTELMACIAPVARAGCNFKSKDNNMLDEKLRKYNKEIDEICRDWERAQAMREMKNKVFVDADGGLHMPKELFDKLSKKYPDFISWKEVIKDGSDKANNRLDNGLRRHMGNKEDC